MHQKIDTSKLQIKTYNNEIKNKLESNNIIEEDIKNSEKEKDENINLKDYSIDYCLENDSIEVFQQTEHTTKIEQRSSIKNSTSMNKKKKEGKGKKKK